MEPARIGLNLDGDIEVVRATPRRRLLPRRRKDPTNWSEDEIRETFVTAYIGATTAQGHPLVTAGIVLHVPAELMPRKIVRYQNEHFGEWRDWQAWMFGWDDYLWGCVQMGDDPIDLVRDFGATDTEEAARTSAREMAGEVKGDVGYFDLPTPARQTLSYAVRRGSGYFFR